MLDPEQHVLVQVATPTREGVEHYQDERHEIERLVGEINGRYSRIGLPVIHYLYQSLPFDELIALYRAGDVMLVTPFRDGMNLVAKEYAAAHIDGDGVLVLSEFAGAAEELTDAVLVNPHDDRALQQAIRDAVEMHRHERRATHGRAARPDPQARRARAGRRSSWTRCAESSTRRAAHPASTGTGRAASTTRRRWRNTSPRCLDRCSSASTSTACSRRSSPTPTSRR